MTILLEKPKVPERPSVRRDLKKAEGPPDVYPREDKATIEQKRKSERFETYTDFVERSTDFIDEPGTPVHEIKIPVSLVDHYGYTQIPEPREETYPQLPRSNTSTLEQPHHHQQQHCVQNLDLPDGSCFSRQQNNIHAPESKPRSLEKDKTPGVVNRAMMVARSMGLHGNSAKSSNSPRATRKRNTILASKYLFSLQVLRTCMTIIKELFSQK